MAQPIQRYITPEEYLQAEAESFEKHEYYDGKIYAMAGGTDYHNLISLNTGAELNLRLRGSNCRAYSSDMKIGIPTANTFLYVDASVVCGESQYYRNRKDTIINPVVVVEVLSPSTEGRDRGEKFELYETLPTLKQYILINQFRPRVEYWRRTENGLWLGGFTTKIDSSLPIEALGIELPLRYIYDNVTFEPPGVQPQHL